MSKKGFVLAPLEQIVVNVKFDIPTDVGKPSAKGDLDVTFLTRSVSDQKEFLRDARRKTQEALDAADNNMFEVEANIDTETLLNDVVGIKGLTNDQGEEIVFTETVLADLLEISFVREAILLSWQELNFGKELVKALHAKN